MDSSSGHTERFCGVGDRVRIKDRQDRAQGTGTAPMGDRLPPASAPWYLYDFTENQGIEAGQVLDVVALQHPDVPPHQAPQLLHEKEQLRDVAATGAAGQSQVWLCPPSPPSASCTPVLPQGNPHHDTSLPTAGGGPHGHGSPLHRAGACILCPPVSKVLRRLGLGDVLGVPHQPAHLVPAEGQRHEDEESLGRAEEQDLEGTRHGVLPPGTATGLVPIALGTVTAWNQAGTSSTPHTDPTRTHFTPPGTCRAWHPAPCTHTPPAPQTLPLQPPTAPLLPSSPWVPAARAGPPAAPPVPAQPHAGTPAGPGAGSHCRGGQGGGQGQGHPTDPPPATPLTQWGHHRHHVAKVGAMAQGQHGPDRGTPAPAPQGADTPPGAPGTPPTLWDSWDPQDPAILCPGTLPSSPRPVDSPLSPQPVSHSVFLALLQIGHPLPIPARKSWPGSARLGTQESPWHSSQPLHPTQSPGTQHNLLAPCKVSWHPPGLLAEPPQPLTPTTSLPRHPARPRRWHGHYPLRLLSSSSVTLWTWRASSRRRVT